jgi:arabinofuranosyltransferase
MKHRLVKVGLMLAATVKGTFVVAQRPQPELLQRSTISRIINLLEYRMAGSNSLWPTLLIIALTLLAINNAFIQDDAFISFRYADNLVRDNNFSWNANDVVKLEGYTNFLWTIIIAGCIKLGFDPVMCSMVVGILFGIGTLITTYKIGRLVFRDSRYALLTVFLLGTNYTFSGYMTGGLETPLQTFLLTMICFFSFKAMEENESAILNFLAIGFFSALAILTRLDTPLIIGLLILPMLYFRFQSIPNNKVQETFLSLLWMAVPVLLIVFPWLFWKYQYYGDILPNSFYLKGKIFSMEVIKNGVYYLFTFFSSYYLILFVVLLAFQLRKAILNKYILTMLIVLAGWLAYIVKVGGDFMEFRFLVPVLPILMTVVTWSISELESKVFKYAAILIICFGSISHQVLFYDFHGTDSIKKLNSMIYRKEYNWQGIGQKLYTMFGDVRDKMVIATSAAGAIPYYSKLTTVDMFGVNDRWIAVHGDETKNFKPGHHRHAGFGYYVKTNVNLIIGHPEMRPAKWSEGREALALVDFDNFRISALKKSQLPSEAKIVEIPIDNEFSLFALYVKPLPEIDAILKENNIKTFAID